MGSYVAEFLMAGKGIRYQTRLSVYSLVLGLTAGAALLLFSVLALAFGSTELDSTISLIISIAFAISGLAILAGQLVRFYTTEIAITNRRFIVKRGLIRRDTIGMPLEKVESVQVDIPMLGRIFNYGMITIAAASEDNAAVAAVDSPLQLRQTYYHSERESRQLHMQLGSIGTGGLSRIGTPLVIQGSWFAQANRSEPLPADYLLVL